LSLQRRLLLFLLISAPVVWGLAALASVDRARLEIDELFDTEIIRLQQDFRTRPSTVRFTLRATLIDQETRRVEAWREFDNSVPSGSEDPYGGVVAANRAVQLTLENLAGFCAEAARSPQR